MATRAEQLADAFEAVATANHYMVGIVEPYSQEELDDAYSILIDRQNETPKVYTAIHEALSRALDLIEAAKRAYLLDQSKGRA